MPRSLDGVLMGKRNARLDSFIFLPPPIGLSPLALADAAEEGSQLAASTPEGINPEVFSGMDECSARANLFCPKREGLPVEERKLPPSPPSKEKAEAPAGLKKWEPLSPPPPKALMLLLPGPNMEKVLPPALGGRLSPLQ